MEGTDYEARRRANILDNQRILKEIGLINPFSNRKLSFKSGGVKRKAPAAAPLKPKRPRLEETIDTKNCGSITGSKRRSARIQGQPTPSKGDIDKEVEEWNEEERENRHIPVEKNRPHTYGAIEGVEIGTSWPTRMECCRDLIHRPPVSGIHAGADGAYSIALSGGYDDNVDWGECFTYTGEGGRDLKGTAAKPKNLRQAPQSKDQTLTRGNLALSRNVETGNPVRVIRGYKLTSAFAPEEGYRYDGLYTVEKAWFTVGLSGFMVWKFALRRCEDQAPPPWQFTETFSSQENHEGTLSSPKKLQHDDSNKENDAENSSTPNKSGDNVSIQMKSEAKLGEDKSAKDETAENASAVDESKTAEQISDESASIQECITAEEKSAENVLSEEKKEDDTTEIKSEENILVKEEADSSEGEKPEKIVSTKEVAERNPTTEEGSEEGNSGEEEKTGETVVKGQEPEEGEVKLDEKISAKERFEEDGNNNNTLTT